ncbi:hypothetical protein [Paenibacillus sp. MY03]|nr:hypothetical protein [Paenibacillus sp. MY03]
MACEHYRRKAAQFSREKQLVVAVALSNVYYCMECKQIHKIEEDKANEQI